MSLTLAVIFTVVITAKIATLMILA